MKDKKVAEDKMEVDNEVKIQVVKDNATPLIIADSSRATSIPLSVVAEELASTPSPPHIKQVASMVKSPIMTTAITTSSSQTQLQTPIDSSSPVLVAFDVVSSQDKGKGRAASSDTIAEERAIEEELVPELASQLASQISTTIRQSTPSPSPPHLTPNNDDEEEELSPFTDLSPQLSPHLPVLPSSPTPITRIISPSKSISPEVRRSPSASQQRYPFRATPKRSISPNNLLNPSPSKSSTRPPPVTFSLPTSERTDFYIRSPSGSPLSSLPPTPTKRHRRPHTFSLEIEVPFIIRRPISSIPSASSSSAVASASGMRSGMRSSRRTNSQPLRVSPRKHNRMEIDDEEDEEEEDEEEVGDETQIVEDSEPSHSPRKLASLSKSNNSNSDSDDDEELMAALARAAARRKAGTAMVTTTVTSTTIVSPKESRRSERVITAADKGKGKAAVSSSMGGNHSTGAGAGKLGIAALVKESNDQAKKGISLVEQARALLDASDDSVRLSLSCETIPISNIDFRFIFIFLGSSQF